MRSAHWLLVNGSLRSGYWRRPESQEIALSEVDGYVSDQEIGLIQKIGNLMGIKNPDILEMFRKPVAFIPPVDYMERIVQFQRMMLLINIDQ
ncbi:MAG: hypothetical protein ACI857_000731 [Arenicella sp.]|jgi:hypothetical protein